MARKSRGLRPEEEALWHEVAGTTVPLHPRRKTPAVQCPAAKPPPTPETLPLPAFRVGELARSLQPSPDLAPSVADTLSKAPVRMDRKSFQRMSRGKLSPEGRIDLHGMTVSQAHPALTRFILASNEAGKRLVLVITGKGRPGDDGGPIPQHPGILKRQVPQWLGMPPLRGVVLQISEAHLKHGGTGAYYVYLRRPR